MKTLTETLLLGCLIAGLGAAMCSGCSVSKADFVPIQTGVDLPVCNYSGQCTQEEQVVRVKCPLTAAQHPPTGFDDVSLCFPVAPGDACATLVLSPRVWACGDWETDGKHWCVGECPAPGVEFGPPGNPAVLEGCPALSEGGCWVPPVTQ